MCFAPARFVSGPRKLLILGRAVWNDRVRLAPLLSEKVRLTNDSSPAPLHRRPAGLALGAFERYVRAQFGKYFAAVRLAPLPEADIGWDGSVPTLCIANHTNWWDGFLAFLVGRELGLTSYVLMDAAQLERYPAFKRVGALPLSRESSRRAYRDLSPPAPASDRARRFGSFPRDPAALRPSPRRR
jgi:hypothetical protein